mgnify:CR=1 FL=1
MPRGASHCETISDKARAIGGGALEAAERFEKIKRALCSRYIGGGKGNKILRGTWGKQTSRQR